MLEFIAIDLDREYFKKYGNFLPSTGKSVSYASSSIGWMNSCLLSLSWKNLLINRTRTFS